MKSIENSMKIHPFFAQFENSGEFFCSVLFFFNLMWLAEWSGCKEWMSAMIINDC